MKLIYLANIRLPTEKAHGVQIMKTCEAFARAGCEVELVVPVRHHNNLAGDPFAYYGVEKNFTIIWVRSLDVATWGPFGFVLASLSFAAKAARILKFKQPDMLFGRDESVLWLVAKLGYKNLVWESHTGAWNFFSKRLSSVLKKLVVISQGLKDFYIAHGVPEAKIVVAHDAVDLGVFAHPQTKEAARARLGLPQDTRVVMYIGRLDGWKGVSTLLEASRFLSDVQIVIIGGEPVQVEALSKKYPAVTFLGYRPYRELSDNQQAADVLVLPNSGKDEVSARFTSPLKLFTYLASGIPVVASDLPSIREVVGECEVIFTKPDDPLSLAEGVRAALVGELKLKTAAALVKVREYTWEARAKTILEHIYV